MVQLLPLGNMRENSFNKIHVQATHQEVVQTKTYVFVM